MADFIANENCYLCSGPVTISYNLPHSEGEMYSISECRECGLLRTEPLPDQSKIEKLYSKDEFRGDMEHEVFSSKYLTLIKRLLIIEPLLKRLRSRLGYAKKPKLIDIGCSTGWITSVAKDIGFEVTGLEANPELARFGRERYNLNIIESYVEKVEIDGKFDSASMFHVLEHLPHPLGTLNKVHSLLNDDGRLLIVVPNASSLGVKIFKQYYNWSAPQHLSFFSPESLETLLSKAGFEVEQITHLSSPPLMLSSYNNVVEAKQKPALAVRNPYLGNLIFSIPAIIGKLIGMGEVIAVYAKKPRG